MLKIKVIGKYTVTEAGIRESIKKVGAFEKIRGMMENKEGDDDTLKALSIYPLIYGCVTPSLSIEDFLNTPEQELDKLTQAIMELNPHWFALPEEEKQKKTSETRPTYTANSKK